MLRSQTDAVLFHYIGCGGFLIRKGDQALLLDPYFSNVGPLMMVPFKKVRPDKAVIAQFFQQNFQSKRDERGIIQYTLLTHAHYDHIADLPYIFHQHLHKKNRIIGSKTAGHLLAGAQIGTQQAEQVLVLNPNGEAGYPSGAWIYSTDRSFRILPVATSHAPHWMGINLAPSGQLKKDKERFPRKGLKMTDGQNYSYLIDWLDGEGKISCRIFSQAGAASEVMEDFLPPEVLKEKGIDVLLLCVASFNQIKGYPDVLLNYLKPSQLILTHWENFFKPIPSLMKKPRTVPATNVPKFIKNLEKKLARREWPCEFILPNVNTRIWW